MMIDSMLKIQEGFKNGAAVLLLSHSVAPTIDAVLKLKDYAIENNIMIISGTWLLAIKKKYII